MINSLTDIDGQNDKKLAILSSAMRADQPKDVRLEAIDGMGDVEDKRGIQILQGFVNDPDEEIRQTRSRTPSSSCRRLDATAQPQLWAVPTSSHRRCEAVR